MQKHPECVLRYDKVLLYRLEGEVDRECLLGAVDDITARHAVLRTVMGSTGPGYAQQIRPAPFQALTVRTWPGAGAADVARALLEERLTAEGALGGAPLFRMALHQTDDGTLLSFGLHHLVYDGWSVPVLFRDLSECYRARTAGTAPELPELPFSYAEYAVRQRRTWTENRETAMAFWRDRLGGVPGTVEWPEPVQPPAVDSSWETEQTPFALGSEISDAVRVAARHARTTPFIVLLCATAVAMARVTGQHDLLIGPDTANREDPGRRAAVGFYVNYRPTRVTVRRGERFLDLVRRVWRTWLEADRHRDDDAHQVLRELGSPDVLKVNMLSFSVGEYDTPLFPGVRVTEVPTAPDAWYWRDFSVVWSGVEDDGFRGVMLYRRARVDLFAADAVVGHLKKLLADSDVSV
ncbi:condensation domain-containing protein [Streptomyces sedi]|nr:condensation domain-containing protein [Streptomyces sedi]